MSASRTLEFDAIYSALAACVGCAGFAPADAAALGWFMMLIIHDDNRCATNVSLCPDCFAVLPHHPSLDSMGLGH
jgi:hypothetical protein